VEFLVVVEDVLEELGRDARARRDLVRQVVRDMLLEPAEHAALPAFLLERNEYEQQLMRSMSRYFLKRGSAGEWPDYSLDGWRRRD